MARLAAIDLGTNSVRLPVADVLLPGIAIGLGVVARPGVDALGVRDRGLREGIVREVLEST